MSSDKGLTFGQVCHHIVYALINGSSLVWNILFLCYFSGLKSHSPSGIRDSSLHLNDIDN